MVKTLSFFPLSEQRSIPKPGSNPQFLPPSVSPAEGCELGRPAWHCVPQCPSGRPERCPAGENPQWGTPGKRQTEHLTFSPRASPMELWKVPGLTPIDRRGGPEDGGKGSKATQQAEETSLDIIYHLMGSESLGHKGVQRAYTSTCTSCYPEHHFCGPTLCWALC